MLNSLNQALFCHILSTFASRIYIHNIRYNIDETRICKGICRNARKRRKENSPSGVGIRDREQRVRQIMAYDEHLMMVKVKFNQGAIGTLHQHPHTQSTYVASGCFEVTIGEEKKVLRAGDGYYVAPNLPHGCVCLEAGILIDTFTPMREDFLK